MQTIGDQYAIVKNQQPRVGGMAEILCAIDVADAGKLVAIKLFKTTIDSDRLHLEAYARECRALQQLDHPNIVRILGGGTDHNSGRRYLVLEWLETSLLQWISSHPLRDWPRFYDQIGRPLLNALTYAYSQGVLHRDLKPQNVLLTSEGLVKVADFGISKLSSLAAPGLTLSGFRSVPYSPPESTTGTESQTRDVYGFAALALSCLCGQPIATYDDLYEQLDELQAPRPVLDILERALSRDPTERPTNIVSLSIELDAIESEFRTKSKPSSETKCYIKITSKVEQKLNDLLDGVSDVRHFVIEDLNEACGIREHRNSSDKATHDRVQFTLYAAQYLYHALIDEPSRSYLVITSASPWQPSFLDFQRDSAWQPNFCFDLQVGSYPPPNGASTINRIVENLAEHESQLRERERSARAEKIFQTWASILQAKTDIERRRETPLLYDGYEKVGNRLRLFTNQVPDYNLIGQSRIIEISDHRIIAGQIESIAIDYVVFWVEGDVIHSVPKRGALLFDTRASRQAIHRQRLALDAVRFKRCARPELRDLLISPETALPPSAAFSVDLTGRQLDDSKQKAVLKALNANSFLVVEGPPGTGKTRFITEVVLQELTRNPNARVLIASQTHVALDNVLEQIRKIKPDLKLVRIGQRHDERVSTGVTDLLVENRVETWLATVKKRSQAFLIKHAESLGVDHNELTLGMSVAALRTAMAELTETEARVAESITKLAELEQQEAERDAADSSETYHELKEALREASETLDQLNMAVKRGNTRVSAARTAVSVLRDGPQLAQLPAEELLEWEQAYLEHNAETRKMHALYSLAEEWYLRFGRSRDFFAALIADSQLIAGTCLGFAGIRGMQSVDFDVCIVDEASKATITEVLVPLARSRKWILVGDRNQLPPFVEDALDDPGLLDEHGLNKEDLQVTLLELLAERLPGGCVTRLTHQHRMVRQIGDLVSHCFYGDALKSIKEGSADFLAPALPKPVTWFNTANLPTRHEQRDQKSFKNLAEVTQIYKILKRLDFLAGARNVRYEIAILSGYDSQKQEIMRTLDREHQNLTNLAISCNTVDAFQGREADISIYSVTRCNERGQLGFLKERRRLNVALSRARYGLAIVGDAAFVRSASGFNPWNKILGYIEANSNDCSITEVVP